MPINKSCFLLLLPFVLLSCSNANDANDTAKQDELSKSTETDYLAAAFPYVFHYFSSQDSSFTTAKFDAAEERNTDSVMARPVKEDGLKQFRPYLIYSPDSSLAVDIYSYNILFVEKNGRTVAEEAGPDTEAALVDLKNKTRKRLLFGGPSMSLLDAAWLDDRTILLSGAEIISDEQLKPLIWKIEPAANKIQMLQYSDTLQASIHDYKDRRLAK